jgi:hypothetical protein
MFKIPGFEFKVQSFKLSCCPLLASCFFIPAFMHSRIFLTLYCISQIPQQFLLRCGFLNVQSPGNAI